eukprot:CAMPEP_0195067180 /NCGR_PEP_ID=MMETSP0448-20130528/12320_1 /TAXON_ID=66468 /ORGANISM="Heterocapsa triquestra, Strain CCMP 448" /LENGTH=271 /DNA_ID=CAMNT_0040098553 /DNA_START=87 /DNA_END=899 /DNA_ORIENTATION=+
MCRAVLARILSFCLLVVAASGIGSHAPLRAKRTARSFVRSLELKQVLRVCNAYPFSSSLDVYIGRSKLTSRPLAYKSCGEFAPALQVGDKIDFKVADSNAGTFTISDLPSSDAVLLMVVYRHDTISTAVSFESHVFSSLATAQVAVLDTYRGSAKSELRIQDAASPPEVPREPPQAAGAQDVRSELLRYDSVVAVDPGLYELLLLADDADAAQPAGENTKAVARVGARADLVAKPREAYVVIRCGVEAQEGTAYPQELMVYPHTDKQALGA